jgi:hypothetical protein
MQDQHHIHAVAPRLWPRCTKVELRDGLLFCALNVDRQYDLVDAYRKDPHVQFMNCEKVDDLVNFTRAWGPLHLVLAPSDITRGRAVRRLDECQAHQKWLRAARRLIDVCRGRGDWRVSLVEFLSAESEIDRTSNVYNPGRAPFLHQALQLEFQFQVDPTTWTASADIGSVQRAAIFCVEVMVKGPRGGLRVEREGRGFEVTPSFELPTLWDALTWMLWYDEWNQRPPRACLECRRIFRPPTAHDRKYCSYECAHRVTNRKWRRKDLRKKRAKR